MGIGDFWLQSNNGKKISLESLQELKKSDLQNNSALIRIFNIFDTKNADGTKGADGVLNKEELTSLFNTMSSAAKLKGNASIFEVDEAEDYINTTQTSEGQTLKQLGVKASDLFNFISALVPKNENHTAQVQNGVEALENSYTPEEIEDLSIQTVTDDVRKARQIFNSQNENQGVVSDFVNGTKETFDTEFAASRVNRYLMREALCADLLAQSKSEEGLSEKEYLEAKINLAVSMLPKLENSSLKSSIIKNILSLGLYNGFGNKTKAEQERIAEEMEIELLKDALRKLKPEDLTLFIQRVTAMPDAEYNEKAAQVVENMINMSLQEKIRDNQKPQMTDFNQINLKHVPIPGSIEDIEQHNDIYRKMTFEETFEAERGVQYNQENIMDYAEKDAKMQFLLGMHNKREQIYNILHDATVTVDGNNKLGAPDTRAIKPCEEQLEFAIIQALRNLYGDDIEKMQEGLNKLGISNLKIVQSGDENDLLHQMKLVYDYENGDNPNPLIKKMDLGGYDLVNIANKLQNYVDTNYQNALGGKTLEEYGQEVNSAYQMAYGARNAQHMAEAFAESQQEGVQTVKTVVQTGGMVVMIAGQLVPVGGQIAAAMTMGGLATSTFGSVGVSALENFTKAGGATEEDKKEMLKELGVSLALVSSGMGIGKTSEAAFRALVIKNCPKLLAFASEVGIDATMSLVADYAITGQIDLNGEGIAQLQSILVGILHAKGNFSSYLNTHAGNITTKPSDLTSKPRIDVKLPVSKNNSSKSDLDKFISDCRKHFISTLDHFMQDIQTEQILLNDGRMAIIVKECNNEGIVLGQRQYIVGTELPKGGRVDYSKLGDMRKELSETKTPEITKEKNYSEPVINKAKTKDTPLQIFDIEQIKANGKKYEKYRKTIEECQKNDKAKANELYEQYLKEEFVSDNPKTDAHIKDLCRNINDDFGVKVFLPENLSEAGTTLKLIYQTLAKIDMHAKANGAEATFPKTIDFYTEKFLRQLTGGNVDQHENIMHLRHLTEFYIKKCLLHELTHLNDTIPFSFKQFSEGFEPQSYRQEFLNAGIEDYDFEYACKNPSEFIAVAASGKMSAYSDEFKQILVSMGLPKWMLTMP